MVPPHYVWIDSLPLSGNGKIDRKALATIAHSLGGSVPTVDPPRTPAETRLALVWAEVLGVPARRVSRTDHFFAQGGTSLSALRLVARLDGAVSIAELTRRPVLADLAAALGRGDDGRLQPLSGGTAAALVCFPYAGGNAVNYRAVADALASSGIAVYGVEPPGEAPTRDGRPFVEVDRLAGQVAAEVMARGAGPVALWGHSTGAAAAVHTARLLEGRGADVRHVFVGAQVPGEHDSWPAMAAAVAARTDDELADQLRAEATGLDAAHAVLAAPAYRHDVLAAGRYLAEPPPGPPLTAPLTVVIAADDKDADDQQLHHRRWARFAERVALHELPAGGHYFMHTRAADVADLVLTRGGLA
jgi:surfactin synthase thioesterase subunit